MPGSKKPRTETPPPAERSSASDPSTPVTRDPVAEGDLLHLLETMERGVFETARSLTAMLRGCLAAELGGPPPDTTPHLLLIDLMKVWARSVEMASAALIPLVLSMRGPEPAEESPEGLDSRIEDLLTRSCVAVRRTNRPTEKDPP